MTAGHRTIAARIRVEPPKIEGSRHIATLVPVTTEAAALAALAAVRDELRGANHHAFAWRLGGRGDRVRASDDGEPAGSAGRPMLAVLEGRDVTDVVAIVTRFFGGTRLGVGGLVRAYGGAVAAALDAATIVTVVPMSRVDVAVAWGDAQVVEFVAHAAGYAIVERTFDHGARFGIDVPTAEVDAFRAALRDRTAGRARV